MRCLIVEDDFISRRLLQQLLSPFFQCDIAVDGEEGVESFRLSHADKNPYELICLDIMMPKLDGREALTRIRKMEQELGVPPNMEVKVIMTTALDDPKTVFDTYYQGGATAYIVKPVSKSALLRELRAVGLIKQ